MPLVFCRGRRGIGIWSRRAPPDTFTLLACNSAPQTYISLPKSFPLSRCRKLQQGAGHPYPFPAQIGAKEFPEQPNIVEGAFAGFVGQIAPVCHRNTCGAVCARVRIGAGYGPLRLVQLYQGTLLRPRPAPATVSMRPFSPKIGLRHWSRASETRYLIPMAFSSFSSFSSHSQCQRCNLWPCDRNVVPLHIDLLNVSWRKS